MKEMYTLEYSRKKAAELREKNRAPLPVLAEIAKMPLLLAQQYLTGEKVMSEKTYRNLYDAVARANNQASPPLSIDWDKVDVPEEGLERFVYLSGNENNKALIVRFSGEEWEEIKRLFPEDADIEGAVRAFIIKMLDTDEKRQLYCPKKPEAVWTHAGLPKEETAFYEDDAVRVAVDYAAFVRDRLEQVLSWAAVVPEEFFGRLVEQSLFGPEPHELEDLDDDERDRCLSVRVWRERALAAEHEVDILRSKLRRIKEAADLELEE